MLGSVRTGGGCAVWVVCILEGLSAVVVIVVRAFVVVSLKGLAGLKLPTSTEKGCD